jgi:hypothetical protein
MIVVLAMLLAPATAKGSTIHDYSNIAIVRILSSQAGDWKPGPRRTKVRKVHLDLRVERTLKGSAAVGSVVKVDTEQVEPGPRAVAVPGAWSGKSIAPGTRYVLFGANKLAGNDRVEGIEALPQVELVLQADRQRRPLAELKDEAPPDALGTIVGEYVLGRLDEVLYTDAAQFDALLAWLESPTVPAGFRLQVMSSILTRVISADPVPDPFWVRLAVASFRVAGLPNAGSLADSILSTYLPNLLGLTSGATKKTPEQVFGAFPEERENARAVAARSEILTKWLEGH